MRTRFTWDPWKAESNVRKHGVNFRSAIGALQDRQSVTIPDPDHSVDERRYILIGTASNGTLVVVVHTEDGDDIRLISARRATLRERQIHEEGI